jgi:hypothetical protein
VPLLRIQSVGRSVFGDGVSNDAAGTIGATLSGFTNKIFFDKVEVNFGTTGVNRFAMVTNGIILGYDKLNIVSGEYRMNGSALNIRSSLTNNGIFSHLAAVLTFADYQTGTSVASTVPCSINGSGTFRNLLANPTASFLAVTVNNTSSTGLTINTNNLVFGGTLTGTAGVINVGTNTVYIGTATNYATTPATTPGIVTTGTLSGFTTPATGLGFILGTGGGIRRYYTNALIGTLGTGSATWFPLLHPTTKEVRYFYLTNSAAFTTGGWVEAKYTDVSGTTDVAIGTDGVPLDRRTNSYWTVTTGGGLVDGVSTYSIQTQADNFGSVNTLANLKLSKISSIFGGTNTLTNAGTVAAPVIKRDAIPFGEINTGTGVNIYIAVEQADNPLTPPVVSAQTGNWNTGSTWVGGVVPSATDFVQILAGHNVTLDADATCGALTIAATGTLTANANTLNIGNTGGGARLLNVAGTLTLGGTGTINHNGNLIMASTSTLNMSGGNFNVDGNSGTGGVPTGTSIVRFLTSALNFTGGTFTVVDPHFFSGASDFALSYSNATSVNIPAAGTIFKFGNGVSTHAGGSATNGFYLNTLGRCYCRFGNGYKPFCNQCNNNRYQW